MLTQDKRNIVSATEKEIKVRRVKGIRQETPILKEAVKVMQGVFANGEHIHDDFWRPMSPNKVVQEYKTVKRQLRKTEITQIGSLAQIHIKGMSKNPNAPVNDFLEREINQYELKQLLKVNREVLRKNHYQHMH